MELNDAKNKKGRTSRWGGLSFSARRTIWGYLFISPWIIGFLVFMAGPILASLYFGLTRYSVFDSPHWIGLENYKTIFTEDPLFYKSIYNTIYYSAISVPLRLTLAFFAALLLNVQIRGRVAYRTAIYLPTVVPSVAVAVLWMWILQPKIGVLNYLLGRVGLPLLEWLQSETWSKPALILVNLWYMGSQTVIFLAGLQGIPPELYEAADVDGASWWSKLIHITVPMMTPVILFNLVIGIINSFQAFVTAYIMTEGGPLNSSLLYVLYIYRQAFRYFKMGYAAALATILFVIILAVTVFIFKTSKGWVYYEYEG